MNSQTPIWVTLLVAGIAVLGQIVTTVALLLNGRWQRDQDRTLRGRELQQDLEIRERDHQHDLTVRRLEDQRRLRDSRAAELRIGLIEMVEAFMGMAEVQQELFLYHESRPEQLNEKIGSTKEHFERARPRLAIDRKGRDIIGMWVKAQTEVNQFRTMVRGQQTLLDAHADSAISHGEQLEEQRTKITKLISDAIDELQRIMDEAAQPI